MNRPFPGPYHSDGKLINDRAGILIAQVMGNSGVPAVSMTAALLAAAWDMHEALKAAEGHLEEMRGDPKLHPIGQCPVLDQVRAALAKAEGRAP